MTVTGAQNYTVNYTYGSNNRLVSEVRTGDNPSTTTYAYDSNVNKLRRYVNGVLAETNRYNAWNQLISVTSPGMTVSYAYRPDGLRQSKTVNGVRTIHVWKGSHIIEELDASLQRVARYFRSPGGQLIFSDQHGWYLHNARGDVVQRMNVSGAVIATYRYTAFGMEIGSVGSNANPFRFSGEYYDRETGRIYLRARYFDPRVGRFTQQDPPLECG